MPDLFIQKLFSDQSGDRFVYLAWIVTVMISIVLHELAHGWMAMRCGDMTPQREGRLTGNPLVHMGPFSIAVLLLLGIAWGQMPIDPTRLRGKYAETKVAFAGPAMNLTIAIVVAIALGLVYRFGPDPGNDPYWMENLRTLLLIASAANFVLFVFNLFPVPPLDGSHILANLYRPYARFVGDPSKQMLFMMGFMLVFAVSGELWAYAFALTSRLAGFVQTVGM